MSELVDKDTGLFKVSQSKVGAWNRCKLQFHRSNVEHLKPRRKARPLKFGGIVHKLVEVDAEGGDPFKKLKEIGHHEEKLFREEAEYYGEIITDIGYIMRAYQKFWGKDKLKHISVGGKKVEHDYAVELTPEILVKGRIDGMVKHRGFKALLEHKTHKKLPNDDQRWRNVQSSLYIRVIDIMGWGSMEGTLWNYLRSKPPTRPEILKAGGLSKRSIDTLPEVVLDVLKANKLKPADYKDYIENQEQNLQTWFQRTFTPIKKDVIRAVLTDFIRTAREMVDYYTKNGEDKPPPRHIGQHCSWCGFEPLCRAELQGNDVDFVREHEFIIDNTPYQNQEELQDGDDD